MSRVGKILAAVLLTFGLPAAAAASVHNQVTAHPVAAVFVIVGYECLVLLAALLGKTFSRPIDRRTQQLGDLLDAALGRRMSPYGRYYRRHLRETLRFTQAAGLAIVGPFTPELDDVYVDVGLAPRSWFQIPSHLLADLPNDVTTRYSITDLLDREKPVVLAVIGAPGSGKTTLLRNVARRAAAGNRGKRRNTPVLLALRDYAARIAEDPGIDLPSLMRSNGIKLKTKEPEGWWEQQLHDGRCLILLDGLDEVAEEKHRRTTVKWIERQIAQFPENDFVATSRPHGYRTAAISGAIVLQVRPFTSDQVKQFLYGWYSATERFTARQDGKDGERAETLVHVESRAQEQADDLLRRLADAPAIYDLAVNPLLLTMIANVHRYGGALPGGRAGLYREICQSVLWRRRDAINLPLRLPGHSMERLLATIAYEMMRRRVRDLGPCDVKQTVEPGLCRLSETATVDDFLAEGKVSGLLVERERHTYAFTHHTFGEYLAAKHIRDNGLQPGLVDSVNDPWWRETTLLYVADADADDVVRACLDAATVTSLALAFECERIGGELAPDLRERLSRTLTEATRSSDPERRRLATSVLATIQFGGHVSNTAGTRICPRPVSTDLYALFMRDTGNPAPDGAVEFMASPERPVTGIWASDTKAFTEWVNDLVGPGPDTGLYRLPRPEEIDDLGHTLANASVTSVWASPGPDGEPRLWLSPSSCGPDPRTLTRSELIAAMLPDLQHPSGLPSLAVLSAASAARGVIYALDFARDLDRDLDRARYVAIELTRDLARAALTRDLTRDLVLGRNRDLALNLNRNLHLACSLARDLGLDLDLACSLTRELDCELDRDLASSLARDLERNLTFELARTRNLDQYLNRARNLERNLSRHTELAGNRALSVFPISTRALASVLRADSSSSDAMTAIREATMGSGLANAFLTATKARTRKGLRRQHSELVTAFIHGLASPLPVDKIFTIDLDALAPTLQDACEQVHSAEGRTQWASYMAGQVSETAEPIFTRRIPVAADDARFIRLSAMALAAESNGVARDEFYTIAAGITLLQRRATDKPGTEGIILARE